MPRITKPAVAGDVSCQIRVVRGQRVLLDADLAALYGVTTARLNQQVRRNVERFPADFMFRLSLEEQESLMLQSATSKTGRDARSRRQFDEVYAAILALMGPATTAQ